MRSFEEFLKQLVELEKIFRETVENYKKRSTRLIELSEHLVGELEEFSKDLLRETIERLEERKRREIAEIDRQYEDKKTREEKKILDIYSQRKNVAVDVVVKAFLGEII